MYYGGAAMQKPGEDTAYPAIIDTGSSQLSIPPDVFEKIRGEWNKLSQTLTALVMPLSVTFQRAVMLLHQKLSQSVSK